MSVGRAIAQNVGVEVIDMGQAMIAEKAGIEPEEVPPSAVLACILAAAEHDGWDFDRALAWARLTGVRSCSWITEAARRAGIR